MKLIDILKQQGLFTNDIKVRFKNNQITLNGEIIKSDIELDIEVKENDETANVLESGSFIVNLIKQNNIFELQMKIFGFENLFDSNIQNELTEILKGFIFVKTSKKESFILKRLEKNG